jgi:hypothetical protein
MLGFDSDFKEKVSLGMLALGFDIEQACSQSNTKQFDLMAGTGKQTNYKAKMALTGPRLRSIQLVKTPWLRWVFALYDRFFRT